MRKIFWLFFIAVIAAGGWFAWTLLSPLEPPAQTFVILHPGYSTRHIAAALKSAGVIRNADVFVFWQYLRPERSLKAGEYLFEKPANILDVKHRLQSGDVYFHTVIIPEGFTMFDIARAIEAAGLGSAQDFLKVAQSDVAQIADLAPGATSLEGYLFPDTYQFSRMLSMHEMAAAMVKQFRQVAHQIGLIQVQTPTDGTAGDTSNSSPHIVVETDVERTVIMASIVEKETASPDERPRVASVYYNRLSQKMALDADPSIIYAELLAGTYQGALHHADLSVSSPYNTYRFPGLPPGPIGNPGKSSLEAALHPGTTSFLYFVADGSGHHRFAQNLEEHNRNVAAYRRSLGMR